MNQLPKLGVFGNLEACEDGILDAINSNFVLLDALLQLNFINIVASLPLSPSDGDTYILSTNNSINYYKDSAWVSYLPDEGFWGYNNSANSFYYFNGTSWVLFKPIYEASEITVIPSGNLTSTNVQAALLEHQADIDALSAVSSFGSPQIKWSELGNSTYGIPVLIEEEGFEVYEFDTLSKATICLTGIFKVPLNYVPGSPLSLNITFYSKQSSVNAQFNTIISLYRSSYITILGTQNFNGSVQALTANNIYRQNIRITDATGQINTNAIQAGDNIRIYLLNNGPSNTTTESVFLFNNATEVRQV
jgi:hypothetical protein